jgi:succinyl-CoA synthetase beta subunit
MCVDDDALYRQPEVLHMVDASQVAPRDLLPPFACQQMGGTIGCLSNGVGNALATADLVYRYQGMPGSVVTIGSDVVEEQLVAGLKMIQKNHRVIFVNLFTGLIDGERVAKVIKKEGLEIPMVVWLEGTNASGGRRELKDLFPRCMAAKTLEEAAKVAVDLIGPTHTS